MSLCPPKKYNELFVFDEVDILKRHSMIKIIGVGKFGSDVVESINRAELHDIDFITVNQGQKKLSNDLAPLQNGVRDIERFHIDSDSPTLERQIYDILGENITLVFVVSNLEEGYSSIISAICHHVHVIESIDGNQVAFALLKKTGGDNEMNTTGREIVEAITSEATKVMFFDGTNDLSQTSYSTIDYVSQNIIGVIRIVCKTFIDYEYCCIDYNDVATVLQSGTKAIYSTAEGKGGDRGKKAAMELKQNIESQGYKMEDVKNMLLLMSFSRLHIPTVEECSIITDSLNDYIGEYATVLWNASNDVPEDSDSIVFSSIVLV